MALRQEGVFARMVMEHDLRELTGNPEARLDPDQGLLIQKLVDCNSMPGPQNLFLWGYSGTGKTLFICEALKMKLGKIKKMLSEGKKVRVIVTVFNSDMKEYIFDLEEQEQELSGYLMKDLKEKYLQNIADGEFIDFIHFKLLLQKHAVGDFLSESEKLGHTIDFLEKNTDMSNVMERFKILHNEQMNKSEEARRKQMDEKKNEIEQPIKKRINEIINSLSSSNDHTVLLIDEVPTILEQDWSDVRVAIQ